MVKISTYAELERYTMAFKKNYLNLLIIVSDGGLAKTHLVRNLFKDTAHLYICSHVTPLSLHEQCYYHRDKPIILDDVDNLLKQKLMVSILKALTNTEKVKEMNYFSTCLNAEIVPQRFTTSSPVVILTNQITIVDKNLDALSRRAVTLEFIPSNNEIFAYAKANMPLNEEVLYFFDQNLPEIKSLNLRDFVKVQQFYNVSKEVREFNWQLEASKLLGLRSTTLLYREICNKYNNTKARLKAFIDAGYSRSYFFKLQKQGVTNE